MKKSKPIKKPVGDTQRYYGDSIAKILKFWFWPRASTEAMHRAEKDLEKFFELSFRYNEISDTITLRGRTFYPGQPLPESRLTLGDLKTMRLPEVAKEILKRNKDLIEGDEKKDKVLSLSPEETLKTKQTWNVLVDKDHRVESVQTKESTWEKAQGHNFGEKKVVEILPSGVRIVYIPRDVLTTNRIPKEFRDWLIDEPEKIIEEDRPKKRLMIEEEKKRGWWDTRFWWKK